MNTDDFEKELERRPLRPVPNAWREEILATARQNLPTPNAATHIDSPTAWRALLSHFPIAWGAVAAIWLIIIGANMLMSESTSAVVAGASVPVEHEAMTVWNLQRVEFGLLANQSMDRSRPAPKPAVTPGAPRSDRESDGGFGEFAPIGINPSAFVIAVNPLPAADERLFADKQFYET